MPKMDGFQLLKNVKDDNNLKNITFVFYTATYVDKKDMEFGLKLGAVEYIKKPADPEEFIKIIQGEIRADDFLPKPVQVDELFEKMALCLKFVWVYAKKTKPPSKPKIQEEKILFPSKEDLEKLYGYAQQYYYQGLEEQLKLIKKEEKRFLPFVVKIQQLAEDYRMTEIIELLQKNIEERT